MSTGGGDGGCNDHRRESSDAWGRTKRRTEYRSSADDVGHSLMMEYLWEEMDWIASGTQSRDSSERGK